MGLLGADAVLSAPVDGPAVDVIAHTSTPVAAGSEDVERRVAGVVGVGLAREVEEYFEHGASVHAGDVVVDVGANIGAFAVDVAVRTRSDVTLHCFEAAAPIFAQLERHFREHAILRATRHELHAVALCSPEQHGQVRPFYYFRRFPTDSTYDLDRKLVAFREYFRRVARDIELGVSERRWPIRVPARTVAHTLAYLSRDESRLGVWLAMRVTGMRELRCDLASLDRVLAARNITRVDLLKIDVEGAELDVLRGCGTAWPMIRRVVVETDRRAGRADTVVALLVERGLRITSCRPPHVAEAGDRELVLICAERP